MQQLRKMKMNKMMRRFLHVMMTVLETGAFQSHVTYLDVEEECNSFIPVVIVINLTGGFLFRDVPSSAALPIIRPALGRQHSMSDRAKVAMQGYLNHFLGNMDIVNSREVLLASLLMLLYNFVGNLYLPDLSM